MKKESVFVSICNQKGGGKTQGRATSKFAPWRETTDGCCPKLKSVGTQKPGPLVRTRIG